MVAAIVISFLIIAFLLVLLAITIFRGVKQVSVYQKLKGDYYDEEQVQFKFRNILQIFFPYYGRFAFKQYFAELPSSLHDFLIVQFYCALLFGLLIAVIVQEDDEFLVYAPIVVYLIVAFIILTETWFIYLAYTKSLKQSNIKIQTDNTVNSFLKVESQQIHQKTNKFQLALLIILITICIMMLWSLSGLTLINNTQAAILLYYFLFNIGLDMPFRVLLCLILGLSNLLPMVTVIYYIDEYQKSPIKNRDPLLDFLNFDSPNTQRNSVYPSPRFKIAWKDVPSHSLLPSEANSDGFDQIIETARANDLEELGTISFEQSIVPSRLSFGNIDKIKTPFEQHQEMWEKMKPKKLYFFQMEDKLEEKEFSYYSQDSKEETSVGKIDNLNLTNIVEDDKQEDIEIGIFHFLQKKNKRKRKYPTKRFNRPYKRQDYPFLQRPKMTQTSPRSLPLQYKTLDKPIEGLFLLVYNKKIENLNYNINLTSQASFLTDPPHFSINTPYTPLNIKDLSFEESPITEEPNNSLNDATVEIDPPSDDDLKLEDLDESEDFQNHPMKRKAPRNFKSPGQKSTVKLFQGKKTVKRGQKRNRSSTSSEGISTPKKQTMRYNWGETGLQEIVSEAEDQISIIQPCNKYSKARPHQQVSSLSIYKKKWRKSRLKSPLSAENEAVSFLAKQKGRQWPNPNEDSIIQQLHKGDKEIQHPSIQFGLTSYGQHPLSEDEPEPSSPAFQSMDPRPIEDTPVIFLQTSDKVTPQRQSHNFSKMQQFLDLATQEQKPRYRPKSHQIRRKRPTDQWVYSYDHPYKELLWLMMQKAKPQNSKRPHSQPRGVSRMGMSSLSPMKEEDSVMARGNESLRVVELEGNQIINMQIWKDLQTNKTYKLDNLTGRQSQCNSFGQSPNTFRPYTSGFQSKLNNFSLPYHPLYAVQPSNFYIEKFDGYMQCPRPQSQAFFNDIKDPRKLKPYRTGKMPQTRIKDDIKKIPKPINHLTFSAVYDKSIKAPLIQSKIVTQSVQDPVQDMTLEQVRRTFSAGGTRLLKTGTQMKTILTSERDGVKGYIPPPNRDKRRELKGYFMVNFATEGDLYKKNREILDKANPVLVQARRRFEQFDLKNLMKRREQRVLKNSIATTR